MTEEAGSKKIKKRLSKVGRSEVAKAISHVEGLSKTQSERIVDLVFKNIIYLVIERNLVEIPGFGRFFAKYVGPRKGSHPQTHEEIEIGPRVQIRAEFSSSLKNNLNKYVEDFKGLTEEEGADEEYYGEEES